MKIAVLAPSPMPFAHGGAERLWAQLVQAINEHTDHEAELLKLVVDERTLAPLVDAYQAFAALDLGHFDMVVTGKYPAWMVAHPNHVIYLLHPLRGLYDTYPRGHPTTCDDPRARELVELLERPPTRAGLPAIFATFAALVAEQGASDALFAHPGPLGRQLIHHLDTVGCATSAIARYLALSSTVVGRAGCLPVDADPLVLHPPPTQPVPPDVGLEHLFTFSRIDGPKRIELLVDAMRHVPGDVVLKVAGDGPDRGRLEKKTAGDPRIELLGRVSDDELAALLAGAIAVPFVPLDEDYGFVTVEAFRAGKPVVTCHDSGGPTELVVDERNGFVTAPEPAAIGHALTRLVSDHALARRLGDDGRRSIEGLDWASFARAVVGGSLAARSSSSAATTANGRAVDPRMVPRRDGFPRLVIASTYAVHGNIGGGPVRCAAAARALSAAFDVHIVSLGNFGRAGGTTEWAPGIVETTLPVNAATQERDEELADAAQMPITDISAAELAGPVFERELARALDGASVAVLAHPYLYPLVRKLGSSVPVVYDAYDAEFVLKGEILSESPQRDELLAKVMAMEGAAARDAVLIATCTQEDRRALHEQYDVQIAKFVDVPNGCDVHAVPFTTGAARVDAGRRWLDRLRASGHPGEYDTIAVFIGSWHKPNFIGAQRLSEQAWLTPNVLYVLAGNHTKKLEDILVPHNVLLAGVLPEAAKAGLLGAATVALNPVEVGTGSNLKMLDYFAAGVPVISTPTGTRGFPVQDGREVLVRDLDAFPSALRALADHQVALDRAAVHAREMVEQHFDWAVIGKRYCEAVVDGLRRVAA